jgi:hypothetical protein
VPQPSPYTPGEVAREVPGRGQQLAEIDERLSYMIDLKARRALRLPRNVDPEN